MKELDAVLRAESPWFLPPAEEPVEDPVAVQRFADGHLVRLTRTELLAAVILMFLKGKTARDVRWMLRLFLPGGGDV